MDEQLSTLVREATNVIHQFSTKEHYYFTATDSFFGSGMSIRVEKQTGEVQITNHVTKPLVWRSTNKKINL